MLKNYLKIAWRNLVRNKSFSLLNILGLSIGLTVTALILLWVNYEINYDQFHEKKDRIYQVYNKYPVDGEIWTWNSTPKIMAPTLKKDYPEIEEVSRYFYNYNFLFSQDERSIKANGTIVDPSFLKIFSFPLVEGNVETVLEDVNSLVVTESFAKKMFGDAPAVGQVLTMDNRESFKVSGILKDLPLNSEFNFEYIIPWSFVKQRGWDDEFWSNNSVGTFVLLEEGTNYEAFSQKVADLRKTYDKESPTMVTYFYPYTRSHLYAEFNNGLEEGGLIEIIRLFAIIAIIVLAIACINFMNLSTARSEKRAKEVGVRKVIGARKKALVLQFLGESILLSFIAAIVALGTVVLVLPYFSNLITTEIQIDWGNPLLYLCILGVVVFTGLLAGSYPALYLSGFRPLAVLKGTFQKTNTLLTPRKVLVVLQFSVAIVLITATIVIWQQISNTQNRKLGYEKDQLITVSIEGEIEESYKTIKAELLKSGHIKSISRTGSRVTESWSNSWGIEWPGKDEENKTLVHRMSTDEGLIKTLGLQLKQGRDFDLNKYPTDSTSVILNETAVALMGFKEPLGKIIKDNDTVWTVIGVVEDFVFNSPFQKIEPVIIQGAKWWLSTIHIKLNSDQNVADNLAAIEAIFQEHNPSYPFNYEFVDQVYARNFISEQRFQKLAGLFTVLTILISCLGLFGLASYMAQNRIKEIGVRKVLGASVGGITSLLSMEFLKLVGISLLIAIPISWYSMNEWLQDFAYRIELSWWVFALAGIIALVIAFATVSYQAIKAAKSNPVKSLRTE